MRFKTFAIDTAYDIGGAFLQAVAIQCFISGCYIAPGGVSGIAILLNYLFALPVGVMSFVLNIPLLMLSWLYLGHVSTLKTLKTVAIMALVQDALVTPFFPAIAGERIVLAAFGGVFAGMGMAMIFMRDSTTGGMDIAAKLVQRAAPHFQIGHALMLVDCLVVGASVAVYRNIDTAFYGLLCIVCTTQTIDMLIYGMKRSTMVTVISNKNAEIAADIIAKLDRSATFLKSRGAFSHCDSEALLCVVDKKQFHRVKQIIDARDEHAFVIVSETKEVYGEGFLNNSQNNV
ncbi:MAG TPA: YitT family protein [Clostridia bacterium]|nr:YitT family protein [Clostridia bacterium]